MRHISKLGGQAPWPKGCRSLQELIDFLGYPPAQEEGFLPLVVQAEYLYSYAKASFASVPLMSRSHIIPQQFQVKSTQYSELVLHNMYILTHQRYFGAQCLAT